jgi:hypothetical protein
VLGAALLALVALALAALHERGLRWSGGRPGAVASDVPPPGDAPDEPGAEPAVPLPGGEGHMVSGPVRPVVDGR